VNDRRNRAANAKGGVEAEGNLQRKIRVVDRAARRRHAVGLRQLVGEMIPYGAGFDIGVDGIDASTQRRIVFGGDLAKDCADRDFQPLRLDERRPLPADVGRRQENPHGGVDEFGGLTHRRPIERDETTFGQNDIAIAKVAADGLDCRL
jgi:hypothetical protein